MSNKIEAKEHPLAKIFSSDFAFHIPHYQRPYAWSESQCSELFDDLYDAFETNNARETNNENYFLGSVVLVKKENEAHCDVIDGQQRLTSITILLACMYDETHLNHVKEYINEPGKPLENIRPNPRLTLRELDREFFKKHIQNFEIQALLDKDPKHLGNDAQRNIQANCAYFKKKLEEKFKNASGERDFKKLEQFAGFLINSCFIVAISTPDQDSAIRIFTVMNNRGINLQTSDLIKAEIIGKIDKDKQAEYSQLWEEMEEKFSREDFDEFFSHVRMIYVRKKAKDTVFKEIKDNVLDKNNLEGFVKNDLQNYANALSSINNKNFSSSKNEGDINELFGWLNRIDNSDWKPVAIEFFSKNRNKKNSSDEILHFFKKLERLAVYLVLCSSHVNKRIERYGKILKQLKEKNSYKDIELSDEEKKEMKTALGDDIYKMKSNKAKYILLRLDRFFSEKCADYKDRAITIEHVLPQTVSEGSEWGKNWPDEDVRNEWVHKIANLVLLGRKKNSEAQNSDFDNKKKTYYNTSGNAPSFPLTAQVIVKDKWTKEVLEERQKELLDKMFKEWELN
ncbi:MAG: DUF262 domain-containing protein [Alphaproteobacteria bacterium]|nr:DUF262 domain-containing protein [Alphaproteobacteria bacterium]